MARLIDKMRVAVVIDRYFQCVTRRGLGLTTCCAAQLHNEPKRKYQFAVAHRNGRASRDLQI